MSTRSRLQALEALVEAGEQILAAAAVAMRLGAHLIAGLGADDEFIAQAGEVFFQHLAEQGLGGPGRGP